jgi:hypothetical protein
MEVEGTTTTRGQRPAAGCRRNWRTDGGGVRDQNRGGYSAAGAPASTDDGSARYI